SGDESLLHHHLMPIDQNQGFPQNRFMNRRLHLITLAALFSQFVSGTSLSAQENKKLEVQKAAPSLQQQIEDLKEGQQRMLKELAEIKKLLEERTNRVDYAPKPATPKVISLNVHGEPFRGDRQARVAILEYGDFECSFCGKYAREIYPQIEKDYIQPG